MEGIGDPLAQEISCRDGGNRGDSYESVDEPSNGLAETLGKAEHRDVDRGQSEPAK